MVNRKLIFLTTTLILGTLFFLGCNKKKENIRSFKVIRLTDDPGDYQQVNIDLKEVLVKTQDSSGWQSLDTKQGIYDLLTLQDGKDTIVASGEVTGKNLKEIRFVLGDDNTIMVDSIIHDLTIPSGSSSGLKIKIDKDGVDSLTLDFDAGLSVHQTGTGDYHLKPVIRVE